MAGFGTDEGFATWLAENGHVLPDDAPTPAVLRQRGSTYLDSVYGPRYTGYPTGGSEQDRQWPRTDAHAYGTLLATSLIPNAVINASYRAAWLEASTSGWTSTTIDPSKRVKRQKVDVIEREFFEPGSIEGGGFANMDSEIEGMLAPFLVPVGSFPVILVV